MKAIPLTDQLIVGYRSKFFSIARFALYLKRRVPKFETRQIACGTILKLADAALRCQQLFSYSLLHRLFVSGSK